MVTANASFVFFVRVLSLGAKVFGGEGRRDGADLRGTGPRAVRRHEHARLPVSPK